MPVAEAARLRVQVRAATAKKKDKKKTKGEGASSSSPKAVRKGASKRKVDRKTIVLLRRLPSLLGTNPSRSRRPPSPAMGKETV